MKNDKEQVPVGQSDEASGKAENAKKDVVAYDSYQKVLDEKKRVQESAMKAHQTIERLQQEKLSAEGKKDELISVLQEKVNGLETKIEKTGKNYAWNTLTGAIKREAIKNGCTDADKLIKLMGDADLKSITIGEDFSIESESLKTVIEKNKKENFFLFKDSNKKIANGTPNNTNNFSENKELDLSKLSIDELKELHKNSFK